MVFSEWGAQLNDARSLPMNLKSGTSAHILTPPRSFATLFEHAPLLTKIDAYAVAGTSVSLPGSKSALQILATHCPNVVSISVAGAFVSMGEADVWRAIMDALPLEDLSCSGEGLTDASLQGMAAGRKSRLLRLPGAAPPPLKLALKRTRVITSVGFRALARVGVDSLSLEMPAHYGANPEE